MLATELLLKRTSCPKLQSPAPTTEQFNIIKSAALRVPDHAALKPWQFVVFQGEEALTKLGNIYADAAKKADPNCDESVISRAKQLPHRAPMVVVCIAKYSQHPKVPHVEQLVSAGCAVMAMQQAAFAQGLGGMWRTGSYTQNENVKEAFGLTKLDEIVGFLYLGTPSITVPEKSIPDHNNYFTEWSK